MKITKNGKNYGEIINNIYVSHRKPENFFRKFQGFGISEWVLYKLQSYGIQDILIVYHGANGVTEFPFTVGQYLESEDSWTFEGEREKIVSINWDKKKVKGGIKVWKNQKLNFGTA